MLVGCSYFDTGDGPVVEGGAPETIDLMTGDEMVQGSEAVPEVLSPAEPLDLPEIADRASDGRVQLYPLEGVLPPNKPSPASPAVQAQGFPVTAAWGSSAPSVQVFPLDDDMRMALPPHLMSPTEASPLLPPSFESEPLAASSGAWAPMSETGEFVTITAPGKQALKVYFAHDSSNLDHQAGDIIARILEYYRDSGGGLSIEGHASVNANISDPVRRKIVNLKVSMNRAFAVAKYLIEKGVPAESIRTVAWGEVRPPSGTNSMNLEKAARRVEIIPHSLQ